MQGLDAIWEISANRYHLRTGFRSDLISDWLSENSEHKSSARAINAICERNSDVFARTGPASWGLLGAGADTELTPRLAFDSWAKDKRVDSPRRT